MREERRPPATARRCARRHLGNATEGRRSRSPQMPARCHQRSPRRPVRRVQRGCEGRLLSARAPNLGLSRRGRHSYRARSTIGTFNEPRKDDRTCRIECVTGTHIHTHPAPISVDRRSIKAVLPRTTRASLDPGMWGARSRR